MTEYTIDDDVLYDELFCIYDKLYKKKAKFYEMLIIDNNNDKNVIHFRIKLLYNKLNYLRTKLNKMSNNDTPNI